MPAHKIWDSNAECARNTRRKRIERIGKVAEARRQRNCFLKHSYGITLDEYEAMLVACDRCCMICTRKITQKYPHLDHDHETNKVRGILCPNCNILVGFLERNAANIIPALKYIKKHAK